MRLSLILPLALTLAAAPLLPAQTKTATLSEFSQSLEALAARVRPAVVQVIATGYGRAEERGEGAAAVITRQHSTGSGVIVSADGYIVTNNHVVQGARKIEVKMGAFGAGSSDAIVRARLVGFDRRTDIAVLKIDRTSLPALKMGEAKDVHVGEVVMAFGSPLGLEGSVSMGVVSSTARQVREDEPLLYIQTDAPINPGNSGGPLVDAAGRVVGINTFILSQSGGSEGLGFAIPGEVVQNIYDQIRKDGHVHRGQVGIVAQNVTPAMAQALHLASASGAIAADVLPGGPADQAGIKIGDVIVALNGREIHESKNLQSAIYSQALDNDITLTVRRGKDTFTAKLKVIERQDDPQRFADLVDPAKNTIPQLGILAIEVTDSVKAMLPELRHSYGLVIAGELPDTPYSGESLAPGDVIYEVNQNPATSIRAVTEVLAALKSGDPVVLQIERNGSLQYVTIELD
jgi:serine protease Do